MKRCFKLEIGMDTSITIEIDTNKITPELALDINNFWIDSDAVLSAADGCVMQAVARRAASSLLAYLINGFSKSGAVHELSTQEGWPALENIGVRVVDYDIPELGADDFECTEIFA